MVTNQRVTAELVLHHLEKRNFAVLSTISRENRPHSAGVVVARLVWKSEMAHSSGKLSNDEPAAGQGGHRKMRHGQGYQDWTTAA